MFGKTGVSISNFLNGTQKFLNIANQTIPLVKQVKPIIGNAKTMFKVMNEFKKVDLSNSINYVKEDIKKSNKKEIKNDSINNIETNGPTFFA